MEVEARSSSAGCWGTRAMTFDLSTTIQPSARRCVHIAVNTNLVGSQLVSTAAVRAPSAGSTVQQHAADPQFLRVLLQPFIYYRNTSRSTSMWRQLKRGVKDLRVILFTAQPQTTGGKRNDKQQPAGGGKAKDVKFPQHTPFQFSLDDSKRKQVVQLDSTYY